MVGGGEQTFMVRKSLRGEKGVVTARVEDKQVLIIGVNRVPGISGPAGFQAVSSPRCPNRLKACKYTEHRRYRHK